MNQCKKFYIAKDTFTCNNQLRILEFLHNMVRSKRVTSTKTISSKELIVNNIKD